MITLTGVFRHSPDQLLTFFNLHEIEPDGHSCLALLYPLLHEMFYHMLLVFLCIDQQYFIQNHITSCFCYGNFEHYFLINGS
jgi:hypothetical protein